MKILGLINPIIEIDTLRHAEHFTVDGWMTVLKDRIQWIKTNLSPDAKILINFRDFSDAMFTDITPNMQLVHFLGTMPEESRPWGLMFEEPTGNYLPEEIGKWCGGTLRQNNIWAKASVCSKMDFSKRVWHKINVLSCPCPLRAIQPLMRAFK